MAKQTYHLSRYSINQFIIGYYLCMLSTIDTRITGGLLLETILKQMRNNSRFRIKFHFS